MQIGEAMSEPEVLRERLRLLGEAGLRMNEQLDSEAVLQVVLDSARQLTDARFGVGLLYGDTDEIVHAFSSGLTAEQADALWAMPDGQLFCDQITAIEEPLRLDDLRSYFAERGLPEFDPPVPVPAVMPFLAAPVLLRGERVGAICLGRDGPEFSADDEETLRLVAAQAALVIANARQLRDEQRARAYLETLLNAAPVGVLVIDTQTSQLTSLNREAMRITGNSVKPGDDFAEMFEASSGSGDTGDTDDADDAGGTGGASSMLVRALRSGELVRSEEVVLGTPDGRSVSVFLNATPVRVDGETVDSMIVTLQDLTSVEETERLRTEFLGIISHELRTPLASIKGSAITLIDAHPSLEPAEMGQYHRIISEQADFMRDLIADVTDVVRIETGSLSVEPEPTDVAMLLDDARNHFLAASDRDTVRISIAPELPAFSADRRRIIQVINNLLTNAARNSHETSVIRLEAVHEGTHIAVSVTDQGRGVAAERLPHLFRKFSRDSLNRDRDLGLGLAICKGIVEAHGGRIWAESEGLGLGSRFTFTLPVSEDAPAHRPRPSSLSARGADDAKMTVLVIDDDPRALRLARDALSTAGFEPIVTGDPAQAVELMDERRPSVVLLDVMLPGIDGIDLMSEFLATHEVPVIFLSAYDQDELIARAFEKGAVDYIVKPFAPTELAARVRAALRKQMIAPTGFELGELTIDVNARLVEVGGRMVDLTPIEFGVLVELSSNAGIVLTHDQLLQRVWGPANAGDARPLRTVIKNLRRHLGDQARNAKYIQTVPHVGYRMRRPDGSQLDPPDA